MTLPKRESGTGLGRFHSLQWAFMKGALAAILCFAVVAAFCDAPFVHFHLDGQTEHAKRAHQGKGFSDHTHGTHASHDVHHSSAELIAVEGSDEDAVFLTWLQSGPQARPTVVAALPILAALNAPTIVVVASVAVPVPRSHDPPDCPSVRPRSPPSFDSHLAA
jgi:hypothetical protein